MENNQHPFRIALLCGGPSLERGISLNSARTVLDHLGGSTVEIVPIYFNEKKQPYLLSTAQLYCNTPSDFDAFLTNHQKPLTKHELVAHLKSCTITFPVMHGIWAEDGGLQRFLERNKIPFVGSGSLACSQAFDKHLAATILQEEKIDHLPTRLLKINDRQILSQAQEFFENHQLKRAIVKPARGGSSIGVFSVSTAEEAVEKARLIFAKRMDTRVVIEPFAEGREFTVIIVENRFRLPVAILPTEIEADYTNHQIFDYRKKYLPTRAVTYHCPPRFSDEQVDAIQVQAEHLFKLFGLRDMARFDGWVLSDGRIVFSDFNPVSGMEQNSFLFQQAARIGLTHREVLRTVLARACERYGITPPTPEALPAGRTPLAILLGGSTSERQVSLLSGANVFLKLNRSSAWQPSAYLLTVTKDVWHVPYGFLLNHTVEEVLAACETAPAALERLRRLVTRVHLRLTYGEPIGEEHYLTLPTKMSWEEFLNKQKHVFLALHGGIGEDGTIQRELATRGISHNGSLHKEAALFMDKHATAEAIRRLGIPGVASIPQYLLTAREFQQAQSSRSLHNLWRILQKQLGTKSLIAKPYNDGCSTGVVHLYSAEDLGNYLSLVNTHKTQIPPHTFRNQPNPIAFPIMEKVLGERFVRSDQVQIKKGTLKHRQETGWVELTIGVLEKDGELQALNPSITVAEHGVLSVEEKFMGGTGINITPPSIIDTEVIEIIRKRITQLAQALRIRGYARIDLFAHCATGDLQIIEVNTLPALTPSTVLFHQALAEEPAISPRELLELIAPR